MDYPEYVKINNKVYKINTDFRIAIKCNEIAESDKIKDFERAMAIIYLLFGSEALNDAEKDVNLYNKFLKSALKFLGCGKEIENNDEKPDMDFIEDYSYIKTSFRSDFNINLENEKMHWWEFSDLINGLSNSELGNCCVLNRVRNLRNIKLNEIKNLKERERIQKAQEKVALKKYKKEYNLTEEQEKSMEELNKIIGL